MTKSDEREKARALRKQGKSVKEIATEIGVSRSSVSLWVRDIELTTEQFQALEDRQRQYGDKHKGSKAVKVKYKEIRLQYQEEGRQKAREKDLLHSQGCMLYWAEGNKDRSMIRFANSDPDMLILFCKFLRESLLIEESKMLAVVHCYLNNGLTQEEIENYWCSTLQISKTQLRKTQLKQPISSQQKGRKLLYGVCNIDVYSVQHIQHIYGAIQEYAGINKPEWLD